MRRIIQRFRDGSLRDVLFWRLGNLGCLGAAPGLRGWLAGRGRGQPRNGVPEIIAPAGIESVRLGLLRLRNRRGSEAFNRIGLFATLTLPNRAPTLGRRILKSGHAILRYKWCLEMY